MLHFIYSKGTCVISPFEQKVILRSRFPDEDDGFVSFSSIHFSCSEGREDSHATTPLTLEKGPFVGCLELHDLTRETEQNCEAERQEQKGYSGVRTNRESFQLHKQMLLLVWHVEPAPAGER